MKSQVAHQSTVNNPTVRTALDEQAREFVRLVLGAGLVELADLKKVVVSLLTESEFITRDRLANGLVGAGLLTQWQAKKVLAGRGRGYFLGSYKLLRPLGKGGMGVVYLGEHRVMKRPMALKILSPESALDARRIERFQSEARATAQLDHPNIVRAYDFSEDNGRCFIVMEYVEGIDLQFAVQRDGVMSIAAALDAMMQAASGLAHAHGRGIVHRDIKPGNLLLRLDGVLKISDMGLARIGWQGEAPNEAGKSRLMGTSEFLAPEQALDSRSVDGRADIYSLGCTLYYLLTGKPPYPASTTSQRIAKHQTSAAPDIRATRRDCPAALSDLAMRMMAKRPEDRIPSATELLFQLGHIAAGAGEGRGEQPLRKIAPAGDTMADGSLLLATLSDSSLETGIDEVTVVDDRALFDFASLPPVVAHRTNAPAANMPRSTVARFPPASLETFSPPAARPTAKRQTIAKTQPNEGSQQVMLGIGLAMASMALIAVLAIGFFIAFRPQEDRRPIIKSTEDRDGRQVVILEK